eukprot:621546-Lingulodinium_polyedra.AAC.1
MGPRPLCPRCRHGAAGRGRPANRWRREGARHARVAAHLGQAARLPGGLLPASPHARVARARHADRRRHA